jgi:hypothetical protein
MSNFMNRPRLTQRTRTRSIAGQRIIVLASLTTAIAIGLLVIFNITGHKHAAAAANGDYRSKASGNWNATSTWERYNGTLWVAAVATPTSADGVITIQSGHTVTVNASVTVDQVLVEAGATLTVSAGTLTVNNGINSDIDIYGTGNLNAGTLTINGGAVITVLSGGVWNYNGGSQTSSGWTINNGGMYVHNVNGVDIPSATWFTNSTLKIAGVVNTDPDVGNQTFGNVIYDCPNQTANLDFKDKLLDIDGDFTVANTGTGTIKFDKSSTNQTLYVGGNYYHTGGTLKMTNAGNWNIDVTGNFNVSGGTFVQTGGDGVPTLYVHGDMIVSGGTFDASQYTGNTSTKGIGTVNLYGNLSQTGGTITETATNIGKGNFYFAKSGTQTFIASGGTISNTIDFTINSGSTLDMGTYIIPGSGAFTLASGGGLNIGSANGITSSGASGNVQNTGARNFSTGGNYTYNGTVAQVTGSGLPSLVNNFTMNNSSGVTLTNSFNVAGTLNFTSGNIITNANVLTLGTSQASSNLGTLVRTTGHVIGYIKRWISSSIAGGILFPVGSASFYEGANVSITTTPSGGTVTARYVEAVNSYLGLQIPDGSVMIGSVSNGYWEMTPADGMSGGAWTLNLYANSLGGIIPDYQRTHIIRKSLLTDPWTVNGTYAMGTGSNAAPIANRTALTLWGIYAVAGGVGNALPIELVSFNAFPDAGIVTCTWQTATETNNDFFTLEKSADGKTFSQVAIVDGAGNTSVTRNYWAEDDNVASGTTYYRLKQTDFNGANSYSDVKKVLIEEATGIAVNTAYPNPFTNSFSISYTTKQDQPVEISILNTSGQKVYRKILQVEKGSNDFVFNEIAQKQLEPGLYFVKIKVDNVIHSQKVIKN